MIMITQFSKICVIDGTVPWYCPACMSEILFSQMDNKDFENLLYPTNTLQQPPHIIKKSYKEIKDLMAHFKQVNELDVSEISQIVITTIQMTLLS